MMMPSSVASLRWSLTPSDHSYQLLLLYADLEKHFRLSENEGTASVAGCFRSGAPLSKELTFFHEMEPSVDGALPSGHLFCCVRTKQQTSLMVLVA